MGIGELQAFFVDEKDWSWPEMKILNLMKMKFISGETGIMNQDGVSFLVRSKYKLFFDMKMKSWTGELL